MSILFNFNGKEVTEPGSYSRIVSGIPLPPASASSGNVCIIDTGNLGLDPFFKTLPDALVATIVSGSTNVTTADTSTLVVGMNITGAGIPAGTKIASITSGTVFVITIAATASTVDVDLEVTKDIYWGSGCGIAGTRQKGKKSIQAFDNAPDFRKFIRGGLPYSLSQFLFDPSDNSPGVPMIQYIRACETTPAGWDTVFVDETLRIRTKDEGSAANGRMESTASNARLLVGYSFKMKAGITDTDKYIFEFYRGNFRGYWQTEDGLQMPIENDIANCESETMICRSPEFSNTGEFVAWMKDSFAFTQFFYFDRVNSVVTSTPTDFVVGDLTTYDGHQVATGGTEVFAAANLDTLLESIVELDNTFFLADRWGDKAQDIENGKILAYIRNDSEMTKFMFIGGGFGNDKFDLPDPDSSVATSQYYDSRNVVVVHDGMVEKFSNAEGFVKYPTIWSAAAVIGRIAGLAPQVPGTFKSIRMISPNEELTPLQRKRALKCGVLHFRYVEDLGWVINQSINTLQKNDRMFLADGSSFEISNERICAQINKELILFSRVKYPGGNLNTASDVEVKKFTEGYLASRKATPQEDNLLYLYKNVRVRYVGDAWQIKYGMVPNLPVNKLFFEGSILDVEISL